MDTYPRLDLPFDSFIMLLPNQKQPFSSQWGGISFYGWWRYQWQAVCHCVGKNHVAHLQDRVKIGLGLDWGEDRIGFNYISYVSLITFDNAGMKIFRLRFWLTAFTRNKKIKEYYCDIDVKLFDMYILFISIYSLIVYESNIFEAAHYSHNSTTYLFYIIYIFIHITTKSVLSSICMPYS